MHKFRYASILALGLGLCAWAGGLRADTQSRVNVVAHALATARHIRVRVLAVGGFVDGAAGTRPPFAATLEADLRKALRHYAPDWKILGAKAEPTGADALLTGYFARADGEVQVHVELRAQPEGTLLWQRDAVVDGGDVTIADLPESAPEGPPAGLEAGPEAPGDAGDVIPTLPYDERAGLEDRNPYHVDFSLGYKAFFANNGAFQRSAGKAQSGISMGLEFDDFILWDMDFWNQDVTGLGTVQSLDYAGSDLAVVYPWHLGDWTLYAGPGGRFGQISVNDPALWNNGVAFGNNALTAVAGIKWTGPDMGVDLRYSGDIVASYTGFNTLRLGVFYEFGD